jgi:glycosyltransferase involved in cell wall biosynthesis
MTSDTPRFLIVTPALNSARYISETILSVATQPGEFDIQYHVQDGGSTDGTVEILHQWARLLAEKNGIIGCRTLAFSFESKPDQGMYEALSRGFQRLQPQDADVMTWINADDRLAPGAFATIASSLRDMPQVSFGGGRSSLIDESGNIMGVNDISGAPTVSLRAGLHDGRAMPFIMQEGAFWRGWCWRKVGGLNTAFKFAGDWDLWRRIAQVADYVALDTLTGFHRRHPGQLTHTMDAYYAELDASLDASEKEEYQRILSNFRRLGTDPETLGRGELGAALAQYDIGGAEWVLGKTFAPVFGWPKLGAGPRAHPPVVISPQGAAYGRRITFGQDVYGLDGSYPDLRLDRGVQWVVGASVTATLETEAAGLYTVYLQLRVCHLRTHLRVSSGENVLLETEIAYLSALQDHIVQFDVACQAGANTLLLTTEIPNQTDVSMRLLVIEAWAMSTFDHSFALKDYIDPAARDCVQPSPELGLAALTDDGQWVAVEGFGPWEGPYLRHGLPERFRWTTGLEARVNILIREAGKRRLFIRVRSSAAGAKFSIWGHGAMLGESGTTRGNMTEEVVEFDIDVVVGVLELVIVSDTWTLREADKTLGFIVHSIELLPPQPYTRCFPS